MLVLPLDVYINRQPILWSRFLVARTPPSGISCLDISVRVHKVHPYRTGRCFLSFNEFLERAKTDQQITDTPGYGRE